MKSILMALVLQSWLSGIELTLIQIYVLLCILGGAIIVTWLYFQLYAKGIRDTSRKKMIIVSTAALVLFFVGTIGYVLFVNLGYSLSFLRGYDVYLYTMLLLVAMILCITVLLMYWSEIRWRRRKKTQIEDLRKRKETLQKGVQTTETKKEVTDQLFTKIREEVGEFHDIYDEFKEE
jgi:predicted permease